MMITKISIGVTIASVVALALVGGMYTKALKHQGELEKSNQQLASAVIKEHGVVVRLETAMDAQKQMFRIEWERMRILVAKAENARKRKEREFIEISSQLKSAKDELNDEQLACAESPIPDALIDALGLRPGDPGDN